MSHHIFAIPALNDNYIWAIAHPEKKSVVIVDPGEATPVLDFLTREQLTLEAILITHHHWDHTNGIAEILAAAEVPVYASAREDVSFCDHPLTEKDIVKLPRTGLEFKVIEVPGHTRGHVAYVGQGWVFTGDTLFTGGCGRLFEGVPDQLYHSLSTLAALPADTQVYCGHEYTKKNLDFALVVDPTNNKLKQRINQTQTILAQGLPTVPATIELERQTNPFLRCHEPAIQQAAMAYCGHALADNVAVFAALRRWKDEF